MAPDALDGGELLWETPCSRLLSWFFGLPRCLVVDTILALHIAGAVVDTNTLLLSLIKRPSFDLH